MPRESQPSLPNLRVVPYEDRHAAAFRDLNLQWIEEYFVVEEPDRRLLFSPRENIIELGGAIFIAELDGEPLGCCALIYRGDRVYELSKMAVGQSHRGIGIGRILLTEVIAQARAMGTVKLTMISNTTLRPAMHLYRDVGFREVPLESNAYARGNIALELPL